MTLRVPYSIKYYSQKKKIIGSAKVLDDDMLSLNTAKECFKANDNPCKNYKLLKYVIKTLQAQMNNHDKIDDGFKGFTSAKTSPSKHQDIVHAKLLTLKECKFSTGF